MAKYRCTLPEDINTCPFCDKDRMECNNKKNCSFKENEDDQITKDKYVRQKRWYEKYYKN